MLELRSHPKRTAARFAVCFSHSPLMAQKSLAAPQPALPTSGCNLHTVLWLERKCLIYDCVEIQEGCLGWPGVSTSLPFGDTATLTLGGLEARQLTSPSRSEVCQAPSSWVITIYLHLWIRH
jgi:hypothetical protein